MNLREKVSLTRSSLSLSERKVADYILNNLESASRMNIVAIAKEAGVSLPTVTRLAKKLGCEGFSDFKFTLVSEVSEKQVQDEQKIGRNEQGYNPNSHFGRTIRAIIQTSQTVSVEDITEIAQRIKSSRRVFVVAADSSFSPGQLLSNKLIRLGIDSCFIGDMAVLPTALQHTTDEDMYVIISCSSHSKTTIEALKAANDSEAYVAFFSNYINTLSYSNADKVVYAARIEGMNKSSAFCFDVSMVVVINMLLEALIDES